MIFYPTEPAPSSSLDSATIRGNFNFLDNTLINHVSASSAHNLDAIDIDVIGSPVVDNAEDLIDSTYAAGIISHGPITDDGDGTLTVDSGSGLIRTWDSIYAPLVSFEWASSSSIAIGVDALTYIYLDYNGGSPIIKTTTDRNDISNNSEICLNHAYRESGSLTIHRRVGGAHIEDFQRRVDRRIKDLRNFERASGMVTSETGIRNIAITAGEGWRGLDKFTTSAQNTSGSGDTFIYWYRDGGGGWTKVSGSTQIDNTQYDDGSGTLQTLSVNKYGVHWIFLCSDGHIDIVYGQDDYKLAEAQNTEVPSVLSDKINKFDLIIARIIIQKNAATFTEVATAFETFFPRSEVINHNDLGNIDGGQADEYYHLTDAEHGALVDGGSADGYHTHPDSGSLDTLDSVCERGNVTDQDITGADLKADGDIYINDDETDADAILHFKTSGSVDETLRWDKTDERFEFSDDLNVSGSIEDLWDNVVTVSKNSKGDYDTIQAAIDSITDASSTNRYCVYVMPGIYNEQIIVKDNVDIVGIDRGSCVIKYASGSSLRTPVDDMECWVINMTLDVDEAGVYAAHILGSGTTAKRAKVNFRECYFLTTVGTAALFVVGGQAVCMNCVLVSANTAATIVVADGASNWPGLLTLQNCLVSNVQSGSGYGIVFTGNGYIKIDNSRIASIVNEAIAFEHTGDASLTVFNSNLISTSDAVVKVWDGITAAKCYFKECNLSAGGTNLIDLNSGTGTIGMFNCVIDNNTKPAGLTITSGGPSSNYGSSNIYTAGSAAAAGVQTLEFDVGGLALADGTAGSAAPALALLTTSDAADPQCRTFCLRFDDSTDEHVFWQFRLPTDYSSGGRIIVQFYNVDTQSDDDNTARFDAILQAVTPGDATDMTALDLPNDGGGWAGTLKTLDAGSDGPRLYESSIDMTSNLDGMAAGDFIQFGLRRDVSEDDGEGDMAVVNISFEYNY